MNENVQENLLFLLISFKLFSEAPIVFSFVRLQQQYQYGFTLYINMYSAYHSFTIGWIQFFVVTNDRNLLQ